MNREALTAAVQDLRALAAVRRKARANTQAGIALDNAIAIQTLIEYPSVGGGRLPCRTNDREVIAILERHGLTELQPPPRPHRT